MEIVRKGGRDQSLRTTANEQEYPSNSFVTTTKCVEMS